LVRFGGVVRVAANAFDKVVTWTLIIGHFFMALQA
jgi:hypothetical protein